MHRIITIILCLAWLVPVYAEEKSLSFTQEPYVNPMIVEALVSMISGQDDQVVAIDLYGSQDSNRFFCKGITNSGSITSSELHSSNDFHHVFNYTYVGRTDSNVIILYTYWCGSGSMSTHNLLFVTIKRDKRLVFEDKVMHVRERYLLKKLGQLFLGDRYKGDIKVRGNQLFVSKDHGWFSKYWFNKGADASKEIPPTNDWESIYTFPMDHQQISPAVRSINRR